jgi:hypothetical protein
MITYKTERLIEITGEFKIIQLREQEIVLDDGIEIGRKPFHRRTIDPKSDLSNEIQDIKSIAEVLYTQKLKDEYSATLKVIP